jgi:hypothetical protein
MPITLTATGSGYYIVSVNGVDVSRHTAEREANEAVFNIAEANPSASVRYWHDYSVTVLYTAPAATPAPAPDPVPEPAPVPPPVPPVVEPAPILFADSFSTGLSGPQNSVAYGSSVNVSTVDGKLRFHMRAKPRGEDNMAEQRIQLNRRVQELWVAYDVTVPLNYRHRNDSPSNNKLIAIYADPYEQPGYQVNFSAWESGGFSELAFHSYGPGGEQPILFPGKMFIEAADLGTTFRVVVHVAVNGTAQFWKNGILLADYSGLLTGQVSKPYIDALYLFGWCNSGFDEDTFIDVDNIVISENQITI